MNTFSCTNCLKVFNKKSNLIRHLENKKKPCQSIKPIEPVEEIKPAQQNPEEPEKLGKYACSYCKFEFSTNSHLNRHIKQNRCKVRVEFEMEKEKMFKLLLEQKEEEIKEKNDEMKEKDEEHKKEIKELKSMIKQQNDKIGELIKKIKPSSITNNNTLNNIVVNTGMNKFGNENIEQLLDKDVFIKKVLFKTGSNAFEACADVIYNNPKFPENQTVFCTDLSREKFMAFNGEKWTLNTRNEVFADIQSKIQDYIDMHEEELNEKLKKDKEFSDRFYSRIKKYYVKYYGDKHEKDSGFELKTDEQLIRFFYTIKECVKNNYDLMYNKAVESERKKLLKDKDKDDDVEPEPKKRGRPSNKKMLLLE